MADSTDITNPPIPRKVVEAQISLLIDLLDTLDADPDLEPNLADASTDREGDDCDLEDGADTEPSLGWTGASCYPEKESQDCPGFCLNADSGRDLEDEHCGREPDVDSEYSLGWGTGDSQTGQWTIVTDLEEGVGAVRKKRPESKTGGKVCKGCEVLA
jgi:hypothetical protein